MRSRERSHDQDPRSRARVRDRSLMQLRRLCSNYRRECRHNRARYISPGSFATSAEQGTNESLPDGLLADRFLQANHSRNKLPRIVVLDCMSPEASGLRQFLWTRCLDLGHRRSTTYRLREHTRSKAATTPAPLILRFHKNCCRPQVSRCDRQGWPDHKDCLPGRRLLPGQTNRMDSKEVQLRG